MTSAPLNSSRTNRIWIPLLVALALLAFMAMRHSMGKAMRMQAETTPALFLSKLKPGQVAKIVLEVTAVAPAASVEGSVLDKESETVYHRTANSMKILFDATTPVVMGKSEDIHPGAVVHITARMASDNMVHANQIVILTGYVKVKAR
ncbi:MAG: hypothetical protein WA718_01850 [Terriglobales bacterium]